MTSSSGSHYSSSHTHPTTPTINQRKPEQQEQQQERPLFRPEWTDAALDHFISLLHFVTKTTPLVVEWLQELAQEAWQHHPWLLLEYIAIHLIVVLQSIDFVALLLQAARNLPSNLKRAGEAGVLLGVFRFVQVHSQLQNNKNKNNHQMKVAAVFGFGPGLGQALAVKWLQEGYQVAILSRSKEKVESAAAQLGEKCQGFACDVTQPDDVQSAISTISRQLGPIDTVLYNAGNGVFKPWQQLEHAEFQSGFQTNVAGLLAVSQAVVPCMLATTSTTSNDDDVHDRKGVLLVTGATASLRGKPITAGFAPHKGAQRLLCQSLARDLGPQGIHVGYFIIDGMIGRDNDDGKKVDTKLSPASIAQTYWNVATQDKSCWSFETEVRPSQESW
mmetsp:Transcript_25287/g.59198  ORF Transcript_25287/g.59198 Transcript_25287/m.59198 type:complete len:388 (+) Transcript_25287:54-1217(+)